jgi:Lysozyme inhibitor LprI
MPCPCVNSASSRSELHGFLLAWGLQKNPSMSPPTLINALKITVSLILATAALACNSGEQPHATTTNKQTASTQRPAPKSVMTQPPQVRADALVKAAARTHACDKPLPAKLEALQNLAAKQQPCAMAALGARYLDGQGGTIKEGLRLSRAAWDKGAQVSSLFCMATAEGIGGKPDPTLALRCFLRSEDWTRAAVMAMNGEGAPRDFAQALIARDGGGWSCGDGVKEAVAQQRRASTAKPARQSHCDLCPDNNVHGFLWGGLERVKRAHKVEQQLAPHLARVSGVARAALAALRKAAARYAEDESTKVYHEYIEGSARGGFAELRKVVIQAHLADDLGHLLSGKLPAVSNAQLARLDRALALALRQHRAEEGAAAYRKQLRQSRRSWLAYRAAWARFANAVAPAARNAVRVRLTVQRIHLLVWSPATNDKTNLEELVQDLVKAGVYTNGSSAEIDKPLRAVDAFEHTLSTPP